MSIDLNMDTSPIVNIGGLVCVCVCVCVCLCVCEDNPSDHGEIRTGAAPHIIRILGLRPIIFSGVLWLALTASLNGWRRV